MTRTVALETVCAVYVLVSCLACSFLFQTCRRARAQRTGVAVTTYARRWPASPSVHVIRASVCAVSARVWVGNIFRFASVCSNIGAGLPNTAFPALSFWCVWIYAEVSAFPTLEATLRSHTKIKTLRLYYNEPWWLFTFPVSKCS